MAARSKIHIILTGGTIDSKYDGKSDTVVPRRHSIIPEFIRSIKLYEKFQFTELFMKDSRKITKNDMKKIVKTLSDSRSRKIIILHGTYTMPETARFLKANLDRRDQVIILTGSMIPLEGFTMSDAGFNLGYSISQLDLLKPGVYVCMNGKTFLAEESMKEISRGMFVSIFSRIKQ